MARIRKYTPDEQEIEALDMQNLKTSIKKTEETKSVEHKQVQKTELQSTQRESVVNSFFELFGNQIFENLRNNKDINVGAETEQSQSGREWFQNLVDTYISDEDIALLLSNLNSVLDVLKIENESLKSELSKKTSEIEKLKSRIQSVETETDALFVENKSLKKEVSEKVSFSKVIEAVFRTESEKVLKTLLTEAADDFGGEETDEFILAFISGWMRISVTVPLAFGNPDEEDGVELLDDALRFLLEQIRNKAVPQRRALLEAVARFVSSKFKDFEFISPEESSQIDINLHNVPGTGGNKVKQGVSFAVVRKQNRRTFKYADIEIF